ncbi:uncharacterized protein P174DRAFT_50338 [Aspergillus novofumigatus IBT 16806]|uniref:Uncharacterized protein n=1 Tax=Aspergillus novofumigatus (strain IBT 16806) TaxID=1392255 RepID=A0A2I1CPH8_ASPN1|nr:uncharacterized protein P174DRAFT_50338 [Aspergillus novofumigatus IBT 16806]PKX99527.1 hypothetical protein P174DRAFT_50338 [Aspergillus novofumigatus IBT 16806]
MPCGPRHAAGIDAPFGMKTPRGTEATCGPRHPAGVDTPFGVRTPRGTEATCGPRHPAGVDAHFGVRTPRGTEVTGGLRHPAGVDAPAKIAYSLGGEATHRCSPPDSPSRLISVPRHFRRAFRSDFVGVGGPGPSAPPLSHPCNCKFFPYLFLKRLQQVLEA